MTGINQLPRCYGNSVAMATKSETLIIPFPSVILNQYLARRFLGMTGISQLPCCYGNSVAMATKSETLITPLSSIVLS